MKKHEVITAIQLFLIDKSERVLLSRRYNTGYEDGNYSVVAGHIEKGKTVRQAMQREAKEEAGIHIDFTDLQFRHVTYRKAKNDSDSDRIDSFLTAYDWKGTIKIIEKNKCDDLKWYHLNDLPKNIIPYISTALKEFSSKSTFSEYGW